MDELISIVIPIYNVEKYLKNCVDSVCNQTYQNLEIILVDDGSPDHCPEICEEYARNDSRVRVTNKTVDCQMHEIRGLILQRAHISCLLTRTIICQHML